MYFHIQKRQWNFSNHPFIYHPNPIKIFLYMLEHGLFPPLPFSPSIFLDAFQVADLTTLPPDTSAETSTFDGCVRFALACNIFGAFPTVSCLSPPPPRVDYLSFLPCVFSVNLFISLFSYFP